MAAPVLVFFSSLKVEEVIEEFQCLCLWWLISDWRGVAIPIAPGF